MVGGLHRLKKFLFESLTAGLGGADTRQWGWKPGCSGLGISLYGSVRVLAEGQLLTGHPSVPAPLPAVCAASSVGLFSGTTDISVIKWNTPFWRGRVARNRGIFSCSCLLSDFLRSLPRADKPSWAGQAPL